MSVLAYNTVNLSVLETRQCDRQVRYSEDKADMLWEDWTIAVVATWNASAPGTQDGTSPALNDIAVHHLLMTPGRTLRFSFPGTAAGGGPPVLQTILSAPEANASGGINPCDADNGPTPLFCTISRVMGDATTFIVNYAIKAAVRFCGAGTPAASALISNRWDMSYQFDNTNYATARTVTGRAVLDVGRLRNDGVFADWFRGSFFFPVPPDFQRDVVNVRASPDGTSVDYTVIDQEQMIQLNSRTGSGATRSQVTNVEVAFSQAYQSGGYSGGLANTLGTLANFKFAKPEAGAATARKGLWGPRVAGGGGIGAKIGSAAAVGALVVSVLDSLSPVFEEEISISVTGNKYSLKSRLYQMALSIAYSMIPKNRGGGRLLPAPQKFVVTYDMKGKTVSVTLGRSYGALSPVGGSAGFDAAVYGSVSESVTGADWLSAPPAGTPGLPDAGFTILAPTGLTNPFPPGDGTSVLPDGNGAAGYAGSYVKQLVTQALKFPCAPPAVPSPAIPNLPAVS